MEELSNDKGSSNISGDEGIELNEDVQRDLIFNQPEMMRNSVGVDKRKYGDVDNERDKIESLSNFCQWCGNSILKNDVLYNGSGLEDFSLCHSCVARYEEEVSLPICARRKQDKPQESTRCEFCNENEFSSSQGWKNCDNCRVFVCLECNKEKHFVVSSSQANDLFETYACGNTRKSKNSKTTYVVPFLDERDVIVSDKDPNKKKRMIVHFNFCPLCDSSYEKMQKNIAGKKKLQKTFFVISLFTIPILPITILPILIGLIMTLFFLRTYKKTEPYFADFHYHCKIYLAWYCLVLMSWIQIVCFMVVFSSTAAAIPMVYFGINRGIVNGTVNATNV